MMTLRAHRDLVDGWKFPIHEAAGYVGRQLWASVVAALLVYVPVAAVVLVSPPPCWNLGLPTPAPCAAEPRQPQAARAQPPGQCSWHARRSRVSADRRLLAVHARRSCGAPRALSYSSTRRFRPRASQP